VPAFELSLVPADKFMTAPVPEREFTNEGTAETVSVSVYPQAGYCVFKSLPAIYQIKDGVAIV
jgi:hypothetical protein